MQIHEFLIISIPISFLPRNRELDSFQIPILFRFQIKSEKFELNWTPHTVNLNL